MPQAPHNATSLPPERASVLLVDDTPANLVALRAILDAPDYDLMDARSGEEALRRLKGQEFAAVLLDVRMPGLSGFDTAKLVRADERSRHTQIIFLTADDLDRAQVEAGYALGAVDFFVKPLSPVVVQAKVRGFVTLFREKQRARREAEQLRLIVQGTIDYAIFMLDPHGHVATWNAGAERIKQYTADEIVGRHFSTFYPQEVIDQGWPGYELKVAAAEGRFEDEGWRVRKDGTTFWANVVITAVKDDHGGLLGFTKVTRDLTGRRQAEADARRLAEESAARWVAHDERERLRVTLASIGDAVISTDAEGRVEFLNPVAEGSLGWASGEAAGRPLGDVFRILNERTRQPVESPVAKVLREGVVVGLANHTVLISKDGAERPIDDSAALAVLVDFDSTLQKVASLAVPHFADWVSVDVLEDTGSLRRVAVAHVDPAKVQLAHDLHRRFPPDPSARPGVWNILRTGKPELVPEITDAMLVASVKDDELLGVVRELGLKSYIGVPLAVRGKPVGVLTFIVAESGHGYDETDLAVAMDLAGRAAIAVENTQLYRELRDADRRKDEFLAVLAHELRNPLAPIRNGLQVLRLAGGGGEMVAEARSMMERQLAHMVRLVDDLLDVSRITRNKLDLRRERVALATVIHAAVETSRPLIKQSGHTFSVTLTPAPVYLDADPVRLAQVISNLLTNAAKYTEPGGRITLTAEQHGAEAVVRVKDNGLGIPVEAQPGIFEMFSQVDRNMERAQGGLGIGLTLVRRLTEMHGGTVGVTSEGPGRGSEFTVRIPILTEVQQGSGGRTTGPGAVAGAKRRILVVDDNRDAAESLGMMLTLMGNEVRTAHDGLAAVEAAEAYRPEMILLDIGLPRMNGYDACRHIRGQAWANGTVIVALTGWGQEEDRRRSQEAGFDDHLVKPVDVDDLTKLLSQGKR